MGTLCTYANAFSLLRIFLTPVLAWLLLLAESAPQPMWYTLSAFVIFACAALTDFADGYYARQHGCVTTWGMFLDPFADKVLVLGAFGIFAYLGVISVWVPVLIAVRDGIVTLVRLVTVQSGTMIETSYAAKLKTCAQFFVLSLLFFDFTLYLYVPNQPVYTVIHTATTFFVWTIVCVTLFSGLHYFSRIFTRP